MSDKKTVHFPILTILTTVFVTLKLANVGQVATWSWWLVLSPMWIPFVLLIIFIIIALIISDDL